jgi:hypothetical protein
MADSRLGNQWWKIRSSHGRNPKFDNPDQLWDACMEYFQWCEENPLEEEKVFHTNGVITKATVHKLRAMTLKGLFRFIDISKDTWNNYRNNTKQGKEKNKLDDIDFTQVCEKIEAIIYDQKYTGAAADLLNSNIIARDLGLSEKVDHTSKGEKIAQQTFVVPDFNSPINNSDKPKESDGAEKPDDTE